MAQTSCGIQSKNKGKLQVFWNIYVMTYLPVLVPCLRPFVSFDLC